MKMVWIYNVHMLVLTTLETIKFIPNVFISQMNKPIAISIG